MEQTTTEMEASTEALQTSEQTSERPESFEEPDFAALTSFVEDDVVEAVEETPAEAPPVEAEAEVTEEAVEQEAAPPEESAESAESESTETAEEKEEAEVKAEEEPKQEPVKLPTREELEGLYAEHREKTLPELEKVFTLSEEEAAALDEQPSKVLPKLAAQLQYDVMLSTYNAVLQAMPSVMGTLMHTTKLADQAQAQFMEKWPDLNNKKAEPAVRAAIQAYRAANPRASLEETIKNAGVMAMINLGLDPTKSQQQVQKKPALKAAPPKPAAPTGQQPAPPVRQESEENVFAEIARVFDQSQN